MFLADTPRDTDMTRSPRWVDPVDHLGQPVGLVGMVVYVETNYRDHAAETGGEIPPGPPPQLKSAGTVGGPDDELLMAVGSRQRDWKEELAMVIGLISRCLALAEEAPERVGGYTISRCLSERGFRRARTGQRDSGKCHEARTRSVPGCSPLTPGLSLVGQRCDPPERCHQGDD